MKKKIAIVFYIMAVGGAEKALIEFLRRFDTERYDVTLFTLNENGEYLNEISKDIRIEYIECTDTKSILLEDIKHLRIRRVIKGIALRILIRLCRSDYEKFAFPMMTMPKLPGEYDCVIAYKHNCEDTATMLTRISAKKRCSWVHNAPVKNKNIKSLYRHLNNVSLLFCVSKEVKKEIDNLYPYLADKTIVFYNQIDSQAIINKAQETLPIVFRDVSIMTVGRLHELKGQQMIPATARMLVDAGYDIHWYLVGDGPLREEVEREIEKYGVSDRVILLGTQTNPYPYIKNCDIYVQPSFSEGWGLTVQEARILHKPIVTTPVPVFSEQIVSGENGLIVDEMTPKALFDGIKTLIDHTEMREKFVENLEKEDHDNSKEMQKLYDFIES